MRGMSMTEIVVVLAIFSILTSIMAPLGVEALTAVQVRTDRTTLLDFLYRARALAHSGYCPSESCATPLPVGVYVEQDKFVIFTGSSYSADPYIIENIPRTQPSEWQGANEFLFEAGDAYTSISRVITFNGQTEGIRTIEVSVAGAILVNE